VKDRLFRELQEKCRPLGSLGSILVTEAYGSLLTYFLLLDFEPLIVGLV
jgi:hypothetical protein